MKPFKKLKNRIKPEFFTLKKQITEYEEKISEFKNELAILEKEQKELE